MELLDQVRGEVEEHAKGTAAEPEEYTHAHAAEQLANMIEMKTNELRAMRLNRRALVRRV
jgi:hypothetical protein